MILFISILLGMLSIFYLYEKETTTIYSNVLALFQMYCLFFRVKIISRHFKDYWTLDLNEYDTWKPESPLWNIIKSVTCSPDNKWQSPDKVQLSIGPLGFIFLVTECVIGIVILNN